MASGFDRVARIYRILERVAFGGALLDARLWGLDWLRDRRDILVLGEGDGRCLQSLVHVAPEARVRCIDASAVMLDLARRRVEAAGAAGRVTFEQADVRDATFPAGAYDAVVTLFFLDCFLPEEVDRLVPMLAASLRPGGVWVFADFAIPPRGWRRLRARLWVAFLYAFFRWRAGLAASALPPSEDAIARAGLHLVAEREAQHGLIRSAVFSRETSRATDACVDEDSHHGHGRPNEQKRATADLGAAHGGSDRSVDHARAHR